MDIRLQILLEHITNNGWSNTSISEVKTKLKRFRGIVAANKQSIFQYTYNADKATTLAMVRRKHPRAVLFEIGEQV